MAHSIPCFDHGTYAVINLSHIFCWVVPLSKRDYFPTRGWAILRTTYPSYFWFHRHLLGQIQNLFLPLLPWQVSILLFFFSNISFFLPVTWSGCSCVIHLSNYNWDSNPLPHFGDQQFLGFLKANHDHLWLRFVFEKSASWWFFISKFSSHYIPSHPHHV